MLNDSFRFGSVTPVSPTTTNLVAWYELEDATDSHTGGYDLTNDDSVTFTSGKNGNAGTFDGSTNHLYRTDEAALSITGAQTWACWVKLSSVSAESIPAMAKYTSSGNQRGMFLGANLSSQEVIGILSSSGSFEAENKVFSGVYLELDVWTHICVTFIPSTSFNIYVGGFHKGSTVSGPSSIHDSTAPLTIGSYNNEWSHWDGQIDDACIFDKALSLAEIKWLAAGNTFGGL